MQLFAFHVNTLAKRGIVTLAAKFNNLLRRGKKFLLF